MDASLFISPGVITWANYVNNQAVAPTDNQWAAILTTMDAI